MRLVFLGTRGSTPVSGPAHRRYGGNTSCVALSRGDEPPALVLDAGTGLQELTKLLDGTPFEGTLLLSHLHWDHTHGMPFFKGGALPGHRVEVVLPAQDGDAEAVLARAFSPPHFPVRPSQLGEGWSFRGIEPGRHSLEGWSVLARELPHKGSRTFGYRVSDGASSLAYLSDHSPIGAGPGSDGLGAHHDAALELAAGVDLLVHDAQHTAAEFPEVAYLGHATAEYAVGLAMAAGARAVALFHHAPTRADAEIDAIAAEFSDCTILVLAVHDGMMLELPLR